MKIALIIILILVIIISCEDNSTNPIEKENEIKWTAPPTNEFGFTLITSFPDSLLENTGNLRVIGAADERVAWVSDWTTKNILKTEDGGTSWILQSPPINGEVYAIEVYDSLLLWVGSTSGQIISSNDGGYTWVEQYKSNFINEIIFFDKDNGIAIGDAPNENSPMEVLHTSDAGATWVNKNSILKYGTTHYAVSFSNQNNGWIRTEPNNNYTFYTSDGGVTWDTVYLNTNEYINTLLTTKNGNVILSCENNNYFTNNYGSTFEKIGSQITNSFGKFSNIAELSSVVYATYSNEIVFSQDSGKTWSKITTGILPNWWDDISSPKKNVVWFSGTENKITYTTKVDSLFGF